MAFFEDLGTKLTQAGQKTKQMTNDLADSAKLNSRMNELTKATKVLYAQLGEKYFMTFGQEPAEEVAELCQQIRETLTELELTKADILRLKGIRTCPECGNENPADANFCSYCSAQLPELPKQVEPKEGFCPQCGARVAIGVHFCSKCGCKLD